jgi:hypothetical protein
MAPPKLPDFLSSGFACLLRFAFREQYDAVRMRPP